MENAADALKMAGSILIFVLAASVIIFAFGRVRQTADVIFDYKDRELTYEDITESKDAVRTVGYETVIPSIFRAYLENYKIVFTGNFKPIYTIKDSNGTDIEKRSLDLETNLNIFEGQYRNAVLANEQAKREFIKAILYGDYSSFEGSTDDIKKKAFEKKFNIKMGTPICEQLKGKTIQEYLGVYYQDDLKRNKDDIKDGTEEELVSNINKTEKRVITYNVE